jgi:hypothetical protein
MIRRPRSRLLAFTIILPVLAMLLATTAIAAPKKPYATDITPDTVLAGGCVSYTVFIENQTKTQGLGSANYTLDSDFMIGRSTDCPVALGTDTGSIGLDPLNDHVIQLRDLALAPATATGPGGRVTFTFSAETSCPPGTSPYVNDVNAKQSNNYSGDPGNDMSKSGTPFDVDVAVGGTCSDDPQTALDAGGTSGSSYSVVSNGTGSGRLVIAVNYDAPPDCANYTEHTDTVTVDLLYNNTDTKTVTLIFNNVNNEPKNSFRFCLDADGAGPNAPFLVPDCASTVPANDPPCLLSVDQAKKVITMKVLLDPGDPPGKG